MGESGKVVRYSYVRFESRVVLFIAAAVLSCPQTLRNGVAAVPKRCRGRYACTRPSISSLVHLVRIRASAHALQGLGTIVVNAGAVVRRVRAPGLPPDPCSPDEGTAKMNDAPPSPQVSVLVLVSVVEVAPVDPSRHNNGGHTPDRPPEAARTQRPLS